MQEQYFLMVMESASGVIETLPRKGSVMYNFMSETKQNKKKTANKFKFINKYIVVPLYRINFLPLLQFGRIFVLLYTKGRTSLNHFKRMRFKL